MQAESARRLHIFLDINMIMYAYVNRFIVSGDYFV